MNATKRSDGLDNPLSPNGPNPLYFVRAADRTKRGPYSCYREAELASKNEDDVIVDHQGRVIERD
jgi:hypothetical protein